MGITTLPNGKIYKVVYQIEQGLNKLSDGRVSPTYSAGQVMLPVLFVFFAEMVLNTKEVS